MNVPPENPAARAMPSLASFVFWLERAEPEAAAKSLFDQRIVSRHKVDSYGQPRILSRHEILLGALAWSTVIGACLGFGLAIFLFVLAHPVSLKAVCVGCPAHTAWQEIES